MIPRPLRIGFVVHAMQVAGAEVLVRETIRRLGPRLAPTVVCLDAVGRIGEELLRQGVEVVCLHRRPGRDWGVAARLAAVARDRRLDLLHAHQYTPFFYSALARVLGLGRPRLILTEHGRHYPDRVSPVRRAVNRLVLAPLADALTACSRFSARALSRTDGFPAARIRVIPNGIDVTRFAPPADKTAAKAAAGLDPDRHYLLHVARHHPVKDQATLLRAFARAVPVLPRTDLLLAGDGPLRGELEHLAVELRIAGRVRFLGIRDDVPTLMQAAEAFVLTSLSEAASLTLLEAMASGLPVVATDVGGTPEIVRHKQEGLLVPRGDPDACAAAMVRVCSDATLAGRLAAAARRRVLDHYRLEQTVDAYFALYRQLVPH